MTLKITANRPLGNHYLTLTSNGVTFNDPLGAGGERNFRFGDVHCVLMSPDNRLSFQVGEEICSIPTDPNDQDHQTVIATLINEIRRAGNWGASE